MNDPAAEFDLVSVRWHQQASWDKRNGRVRVGTLPILIALILLTAYTTIRLYASGPAYFGDSIGVLGVLLLLVWLVVIAGSHEVYGSGPPPTRLRLSSEALELIYQDGTVRFSRRWSDPSFSLTLRDFRALPQSNPMSHDVWLDTGDHRFTTAVILPSRTPRSGLLTPSAHEAILSAARQRGFLVTAITRRGLNGDEGWNYYHTKIQISRQGS